MSEQYQTFVAQASLRQHAITTVPAKRKGMGMKGKAGLGLAAVAGVAAIAEGVSHLGRRDEVSESSSQAIFSTEWFPYQGIEDDALVKRFVHQSMVQ